MAPLDRPVEGLIPVIGRWDQPAFLESGPGFGNAGRWSIYAAEPRVVAQAVGDAWSVTSEQGRDHGQGHPLDRLEIWLNQWTPQAWSEPAPAREQPPFQGGWIGYLGYDVAPWIEALPRRSARDSRLPDLRLGLYDTAVVHDHLSGRTQVLAADLLGEGESATRQRLKHWLDRLRRARQSVFPPAHPPAVPPRSLIDRSAYLDVVERGLEYIRAGDIFQVNLSQRFDAWGAVDPLGLFGRLRGLSPAPFGAYLAWDDLAVISASPEWFYQVRGDRIITRPIKGTRPRGRTYVEDAALRAELLASPKDRAELTMIVDLERNDLGRVCRFGTVRVTEGLTIESFAQVHHLVATIEGRLREEVEPVAVLKALMPGGSITGAPKIRAMQIIDELEPTRRGVYTGAIGYFSRGASAFNIAIRTLTREGERLSYQVGGGIVADSVASEEFEETLAKGSAFAQLLSREDQCSP